MIAHTSAVIRGLVPGNPLFATRAKVGRAAAPRRRGAERARVAVARKLAILLHNLWQVGNRVLLELIPAV